MKIKSHLRLLPIGNRFIIVDPEADGTDLTSVHTLNSTAAAIWNYAAEAGDFTPADIAGRLTDEYDVSPETALRDTTALLRQWVNENLATD